jgi:hypothetical protein
MTSKEVELLNSKDKTHKLEAQIQILEQNIQVQNKKNKKIEHGKFIYWNGRIWCKNHCKFKGSIKVF